MPALKTAILLLATLCARLSTAEENDGVWGPNCTTTLTRTQSMLPTPPFWPQCSWDGTLSIYPSTVTLHRSIDCHHCPYVRVTDVPMVHCPAEIISTTVHVATPSTWYSTVCSVTPTPVFTGEE